MGASERLPVLRVVMEQKMAFPEKSPWGLSHCGKSYKSLNPVTALKILVLRSKVKVAKKKRKRNVEVQMDIFLKLLQLHQSE